MLSHAKLPNLFWVEVMYASVYLINRPPSVPLVMSQNGYGQERMSPSDTWGCSDVWRICMWLRIKDQNSTASRTMCHIHGVLRGWVQLQTMGSCRQESSEESGHSVHGSEDNRRLETIGGETCFPTNFYYSSRPYKVDWEKTTVRNDWVRDDLLGVTKKWRRVRVD